MAAFARALEICPTYGFALKKLFDHWCGRKDFARAKELLNKAQSHFPHVENLSRLFLWHWRQRQYSEARSVLLQMAVQDDAFDYSFDRILDELRLSNARRRCVCIRKELARAIQSHQTRNTHAAAFYVSLTHLLGQVPSLNVMRAVPIDDGGGKQAFTRLLDILAERWAATRDKNFGAIRSFWMARQIDRLIRERREDLRSRDETWGMVGYVLFTLKRSRQAAQWLSNWRYRSKLEPYMLNNLFLSLQTIGDREEARAVLDRGLQLPRHDDTTMRFHLYAALEDLLASREEAARKHLAVVHKSEMSPFTLSVFDFVSALLPFQPGKPKKRFDRKAAAAVGAFMMSNRNNRLAQEYVSCACRLIARHNRSWRPRIWLFVRRHDSLSKILLLAAFYACLRLAQCS